MGVRERRGCESRYVERFGAGMGVNERCVGVSAVLGDHVIRVEDVEFAVGRMR
jgi:hypothetical protein